MSIRLIICVILALLAASASGQHDRPPYEAYEIDELKPGEWYEFGAEFRSVRDGVEITAITPNTTADLAKLRTGDVLTRVGTENSPLKSTNIKKVFREQTGDLTMGFVYLEIRRGTKDFIAILPLSQARRTAAGTVYESVEHGRMTMYMGQLNAVQDAIGDPWGDAPDGGSFRSRMRFMADAFKKMATGFRAINVQDLPQALADRHAEYVAAMDQIALTFADMPENEFGRRSIERAMEKLQDTALSLMSLVKTYDEYRLQEKRRRGD
jgi:hypothetical protein